MNCQVLSVSRGENVRCKSNRYAISKSKYFGFVDSVPPFYLHMKYRDIELCAVELKAHVLPLSLKRPKECTQVFYVILKRKKIIFLHSIK